jgi:hypothetical protein
MADISDIHLLQKTQTCEGLTKAGQPCKKMITMDQSMCHLHVKQSESNRNLEVAEFLNKYLKANGSQTGWDTTWVIQTTGDYLLPTIHELKSTYKIKNNDFTGMDYSSAIAISVKNEIWKFLSDYIAGLNSCNQKPSFEDYKNIIIMSNYRANIKANGETYYSSGNPRSIYEGIFRLIEDSNIIDKYFPQSIRLHEKRDVGYSFHVLSSDELDTIINEFYSIPNVYWDINNYQGYIFSAQLKLKN